MRKVAGSVQADPARSWQKPLAAGICGLKPCRSGAVLDRGTGKRVPPRGPAREHSPQPLRCVRALEIQKGEGKRVKGCLKS